MPATESPSSFFGTIEEIEAHYDRVMASPAYARFFATNADDRRQAKIDAARKRRVRKPSLRSAMLQASKTGVPVSGAVVRPDGSVELRFGQDVPVDVVSDDKPEKINRWDEVLNRGPAKITLVKR